MRKLLSILGSLALTASAASAVSACADNSTNIANGTDTSQTVSLRREAVNKVKPLVLEDQFGLDPVKTDTTINDDVNADDVTNNPNFNTPQTDALKHLNLKGMLGKDNAPLYKWNDQLNGLLKMFGVSPIDLSPYFDQWGGVISQAFNFISAKNIDLLMSLVPTVLENVTQFLNLDMGPKTIEAIGKILRDNAKDILDSFNLNNMIINMINNGAKNLKDIAKNGVNALSDLANVFMNYFYAFHSKDIPASYKPDKSNPHNGDNLLSVFLGTKVLTPLLNKRKVDKNLTKELFSTDALLANIKSIIDDSGTFIASILYQVSAYMPLVNNMSDAPKDADHLFSNDKTNEQIYNQVDNEALTVSGTNVMLGSNVQNVSLNNLYDVLDMATNSDAKQFDIARLTSMLFHDEYGSDGKRTSANALLGQITYYLIDSLKFTNYKVAVKTDIDAKVETIHVDFSFNLSQLFEPGNIVLVKVPGIFAKVWSLTGSNMVVELTTKNNGLLGIADNIEQLFAPIIAGQSITADQLEPIVKSILGTSTDSPFGVFFEYDYTSWLQSKHEGPDPVANDGTFWPAIWNGKLPVIGSVAAWKGLGKILPPIVDQLLETMYYTDGAKLFNGLKNSGLVKDDQLESIEESLKPLLPLVNKVISLVSNTPIGDLRKYSHLLNIDSFMNILAILLAKNTIQDEPGASDPLIIQILKIMTTKATTPEEIKAKADRLNKDLGYVPADKASAFPDDSTYVYANGLIGSLVGMMYPDLANGVKKVSKQILFDTGDKDLGNAIALTYVGLAPSTTVDKLTATMEQVVSELQGDNLADIVDPIITDDKVWRTSNVFNKFFNGTQDLQSESFDLTLDTSSIVINHTDKNGVVTRLQTKKVTYKVTFSRIDSQSTFDFNDIEKISN